MLTPTPHNGHQARQITNRLLDAYDLTNDASALASDLDPDTAAELRHLTIELHRIALTMRRFSRTCPPPTN